MQNNNYKKGSRPNPYTQSDYIQKSQNQQWAGGWVENQDDLIYYSRFHSSYSGICAKNSPVSESFYEEMLSNETWTGGWVSTLTMGTKFYDISGTEYDNTFGSRSNPYSLSVYNDLALSLCWDGGWIREYDGSLRYVQSIPIALSSGGSGFGVGSGNGSGSGYELGSDGSTNSYPVYSGAFSLGNIISTDGFDGTASLSWTEGNTTGHNDLSIVACSITISGTRYYLTSNHITCMWDRAYHVLLGGNIVIDHLGFEYIYNISGDFTIPPFYRKTH